MSVFHLSGCLMTNDLNDLSDHNHEKIITKKITRKFENRKANDIPSQRRIEREKTAR